MPVSTAPMYETTPPRSVIAAVRGEPSGGSRDAVDVGAPAESAAEERDAADRARNVRDDAQPEPTGAAANHSIATAATEVAAEAQAETEAAAEAADPDGPRPYTACELESAGDADAFYAGRLRRR